jgi:hypothetical protein
MRILFNDHGNYHSHKIAKLSVADLMGRTAKEVNAERVCDLAGGFECGVLHLDDEELPDFLKIAQYPFRALLVTTDPGIPLHRKHELLRDPARIILVVRRMVAFAGREAWNAFLTASEDDCMAIQEGRLCDVTETNKPMVSFFVERGEVLPALKILCFAYQEIQARSAQGGEFWRSQAVAAEKPGWWQRVLDKAILWTRDPAKPYEYWGDKREIHRDEAVKALIERLRLEGAVDLSKRGRDEMLGPVESLIKKVALESGAINSADVDAAIDAIRDIYE